MRYWPLIGQRLASQKLQYLLRGTRERCLPLASISLARNTRHSILPPIYGVSTTQYSPQSISERDSQVSKATSQLLDSGSSLWIRASQVLATDRYQGAATENWMNSDLGESHQRPLLPAQRTHQTIRGYCLKIRTSHEKPLHTRDGSSRNPLVQSTTSLSSSDEAPC